MTDLVSVGIHPFWRYAVGPTSGHSPAIPYMRLAPAQQFFEEAKRALPWSGISLYKRRGWRSLETLQEYIPSVEPSVLPPETNK
jgi:hypothetical protein